MKKKLYLNANTILIFAITHGVCFADPIRAQIIIKNERDDTPHWRGLLQNADKLQKAGLIFFDQQPDVILCNFVTKEILEKNIPIVLLEINAAASLKNKTRKYINHPLVKAVFKNRILRDKNLYNAPHTVQTYFFAQINEYAHLTTPKEYDQLTSEELDKIQLVVWDLDWSPFNKTKFFELIKKTEQQAFIKKTDLFFAGRLMCHGKDSLQQFYNWHRSKAYDAIKNITDINALILEGRALPFDEYIHHLRQTKISISPWGWGEWCYRDFETILSDAVLIKPDTSFVLSYPDIYQNNVMYMPCKPDFSDLNEILHTILQDYETYQQMTMQAKKCILQAWNNYDALFDIFVEKIKELTSRSP